ncbi:uncharacterized protein LOC121383696 [Gigantopelta aegis]|uniref:uncharacterized protein LOC121383696 n=1 Tax=Gigantopelta aegis TaxID=1735272 RepID=UPI001B8886E3|nr:uncharacterized protein LOC121383696 [Gigantopelta aegis]
MVVKFLDKGAMLQVDLDTLGFYSHLFFTQKENVNAVVGRLHLLGKRMHNYLDDWLIPASSQTACLKGMELVIDMILRLGFIPNLVKSELAPSQVFTYLGVFFNLVEASVHATDLCLHNFKTLKQCLVLEQHNVFVLLVPYTLALEYNTLSMDWTGLDFYAFPLLVLLGKVLAKIRRQPCRVTLVAQSWTAEAWFALLAVDTGSAQSTVNDLAEYFLALVQERQLKVQTVDLQRQFHLHLLKCSSKTEPLKGRNFNLHRTEWIEQNFKLINKYDCGAPYEMKEHIISPSVTARRIQITWKESSFTLKVDLFGCPSEPLDGKNPQCGTMSSFYHITEGDRMYECVYKVCSLSASKAICSPYPHYYQTLDACDPKDACHSIPCNMGEVCVQYQTNYKCYCLNPPCGIQSGIDIMLDKHKISLFDTVSVSIKLHSDIGFSYTVEIGDLICRPDFKILTDPNKNNFFCSKFMYKTTKGGRLKAIVKKHTPTKTDTSKSHTFMVTLPYGCLKDIQISGTSNTDFNKPAYRTVEDIQFTLSNERGCGSDFKIMKYKWSFSRFESETYDFCINDDSFKETFSLSTDNGVLVVKKRTLLDGYFKVCLQVDGTHENKTYSEVSVTCGYFRIKLVPLELVIKPPGLHQVVLNTRWVRLDASDSKDPNTDDNSGLSYEWKCKPVNSSQNVCQFGSRQNMFPHNGPILEIPENTLPVQKIFNFTFTVSKPRIPSGTASVIIFVTNATKPEANIKCNLNCNTMKVIPSKLLALEVNCGNCGPFGVVITAHLWKLSKQTDLISMKILPLSDLVSKLASKHQSKCNMCLLYECGQLARKHQTSEFEDREDSEVISSLHDELLKGELSPGSVENNDHLTGISRKLHETKLTLTERTSELWLQYMSMFDIIKCFLEAGSFTGMLHFVTLL